MSELEQWEAIFPDFRDLSSGIIQKEQWGGGSNMTSTFTVIEKSAYNQLRADAEKLAEALADAIRTVKKNYYIDPNDYPFEWNQEKRLDQTLKEFRDKYGENE